MLPLTLPNVLTVLRILLVPVIVVALLEETPNADTIAAVVFAVAAFTDGLDGYIARSRGSVTTFGKLMDPLADKLLIIAPLISLVSLDRIAPWVAMVIIARELAVTMLRMVAVERGVVIAASWLGKAKTILQVAAIFAVIAFETTPLAVDALVYAAVAVTVVSGADYFFGVRQAHGARRGGGSSAILRRALQPLPHRHVMRRVTAGVELGRDLPEQPVALGDHVVLVDRLQVLLAGEHEGVRVQVGIGGRPRPRSISRTQSSTKRGRRCAFSTTARSSERFISSKISELIDSSTIRSSVSARSSASQPSGQPTHSRPMPRWLWVATGTASKTRSISSSVKPCSTSRSRAASGDQLLRARAGGHALRLDADQPPDAALGRDRGADQRVQLLRRDARTRASACAPGSAPGS